MKIKLKQLFFFFFSLLVLVSFESSSRADLFNFTRTVTISVDGIEKKTKNIYLPLNFSSQEFTLINSRSLLKNSRYISMVEKSREGEILGISFSAVNPEKGLPRKVRTILKLKDSKSNLETLDISWSEKVFNKRAKQSLGFAGIKELRMSSNLKRVDFEQDSNFLKQLGDSSLEKDTKKERKKKTSSLKILGRTVRKSGLRRKKRALSSQEEANFLLAFSSGKLFFVLRSPEEKEEKEEEEKEEKEEKKETELRRVYVPLFFKTVDPELEDLINNDKKVKVLIPKEFDWKNRVGFRIIDNKIIEIFSLNKNPLPEKLELTIPFRILISESLKDRFTNKELVLQIGEVLDTPVYLIPSAYLQVIIYPNHLKI